MPSGTTKTLGGRRHAVPQGRWLDGEVACLSLTLTASAWTNEQTGIRNFCCPRLQPYVSPSSLLVSFLAPFALALPKSLVGWGMLPSLMSQAIGK
jgi:hypothetical protein